MNDNIRNSVMKGTGREGWCAGGVDLGAGDESAQRCRLGYFIFEAWAYTKGSVGDLSTTARVPVGNTCHFTHKSILEQR